MPMNRLRRGTPDALLAPRDSIEGMISGTRRRFCPSCAGRRRAQTAAYLVVQVIPLVRSWPAATPPHSSDLDELAARLAP